MNLGIFGGTFNPPHMGHVIVAEQVRIQFVLDKILFIPSYISPHKREGEEQLSRHRFAMTSLTVHDNQWFDCTDIEITKPAPSYTIDTLKELKQLYPQDELFLIVGADNYREFQTWKEPENILEMVTLIVMNRPHYPMEVNEHVPSEKVIFSIVPDIGISSSDIREKIHHGESIRYLVPDRVLQYIEEHKLYK